MTSRGASIHRTRRRRRTCRLRNVYGRAIMVAVDTMDDISHDRLVIVGARQLDDMLELARLAADRLGEDSLADALIGQRAAIFQTVAREP